MWLKEKKNPNSKQNRDEISLLDFKKGRLMAMWRWIKHLLGLSINYFFFSSLATSHVIKVRNQKHQQRPIVRPRPATTSFPRTIEDVRLEMLIIMTYMCTWWSICILKHMSPILFAWLEGGEQYLIHFYCLKMHLARYDVDDCLKRVNNT